MALKSFKGCIFNTRDYDREEENVIPYTSAINIKVS